MLLVAFFVLVPVIAWLASLFSKGEGHLGSWRYLFAILIYLVAIPGIFAVTLSIYLFFFERRSIMDTNIFTQVLPIISMVATFLLIKKQVDLQYVPGLDRLSSLITIMSFLMIIMWILDKTHIIVFTYLPFYVVIFLLIIGFLIIRYASKRLMRS